MRTTLNLDERLMRALKARAAASGRTMTEMVEEALRELLAREDAGPGEHQLAWPTVHGGRRPAIDIADRDALLDAMEGRR